MTSERMLVALRVLIVMLAVVVGTVQLDGQTKKRTTAGKHKKTAQTTPSRKAHRDSSASTRTSHSADSTHAARHDSTGAQRGDRLSSQPVDSGLTERVRATEPKAKPFEFRKIRNEAFGVGERLEFEVNYGFITAGSAIMAVPSYETIAGRKCYKVEFTVNSLASFSWVYKVEDRYLTFIDVDALAPLRFEQHISEGSYRRDFVANFDQAKHIAHTSEGDYPIPEYVHDIMSAFYYARTLDFSNSKPGDQVTLYNFYKDKSYELVVRFLGRQELEVAAGTFKTVVVEPLVKEGGLFKSEGRIVIWLTDDERKIPIRVNTKVMIGSIDTELKSYSGLVGPVRARTD